MNKCIPTYIINVKKRIDRKQHIVNEFAGKKEFNLCIVEATECEVGAMGLWNTIKYILSSLVSEKDEYILLCEDDHTFTSHYSKELLFRCIEKAQKEDADILSGGVSWFRDAIAISESLYWMQKFSGLQFIIVFKKFFNVILNANFSLEDAADFKISELSTNKFFIHPFISVQKEFGYSDVTKKNNSPGRVSDLFASASRTIKHLEKVKQFYKIQEKESSSMIGLPNPDNLTIPVYIINLCERPDRYAHIKKQFEEKSEFEVSIIEACKHTIGAVGLWQSIRKIIELAIANDDDVIVICEDDHEFTNAYTKEFLFQNIIEAHYYGADILSGGMGSFNHAIKISKNRFWINHFYSTQFIVVYKKFFTRILEATYDDKVTADDFISELTSNKMGLYPFISIQKGFGYSDVSTNNNIKGNVDHLFFESNKRLAQIQEIYSKHVNTSPGHKFDVQKKNRLVLIVPFYNVENYILECYNSICNQTYENYYAIFVDDVSTDGNLDLTFERNEKVRFIKNEDRKYQLKNFHETLVNESFDDEDIIALLDGDDFLLHNNVLAHINYLYNSKECLVCYGQYVTNTGHQGHCYGYQKEEFNRLRQLDWRASHLKTFKYKVYKEFLKQDPDLESYIDKDTGNFYHLSGDVAIMHPLMEIAGFDKVYFNPEPIYVYRIHEGNDASLSKAKQFEIAEKINKFPSFKQVF